MHSKPENVHEVNTSTELKTPEFIKVDEKIRKDKKVNEKIKLKSPSFDQEKAQAELQKRTQAQDLGQSEVHLDL